MHPIQGPPSDFTNRIVSAFCFQLHQNRGFADKVSQNGISKELTGAGGSRMPSISQTHKDHIVETSVSSSTSWYVVRNFDGCQRLYKTDSPVADLPSYGVFKPSDLIFRGHILRYARTKHRCDGFWKSLSQTVVLCVDLCIPVNLVLASDRRMDSAIGKLTHYLALALYWRYLLRLTWKCARTHSVPAPYRMTLMAWTTSILRWS